MRLISWDDRGITDIKEQEMHFCDESDGHDLYPPKLLRLARSHTREDFEKALRAKSRLGKLL